MAVNGILKSVGLAALAAGIMTAVLPTAAMAAPGEEGQSWNRGTEDRARREERHPDNGGGRGNWNGGQAAAAPVQRTQEVPAQQVRQAPPVVQPAGNGNGGNGNGGNWNGGNRGGNWQSRPAEQVRTQPAPAPVAVQQAGNWRGGDNDRARDNANAARGNEPQRNDQWRNDQWRGRDNDRGREAGRDRDNDRGREAWRGRDNDRGRDGWRNNNGGWDRDGRGRDNWRSANNWSRDWRRDNRYDWNRWRNDHRDTYRLGRYYPPYRGWSYRRLSIGFYLDNVFFGSSYWIDNPWMYRLPEAYGPYRWVRYYDDAVLVNIYNGEVVDVIYDFFW